LKQIGSQIIDKSPECLGHWSLDIVWNLNIGIWDFGSIMVVLNCFNIAGLASTLLFT